MQLFIIFLKICPYHINLFHYCIVIISVPSLSRNSLSAFKNLPDTPRNQPGIWHEHSSKHLTLVHVLLGVNCNLCAVHNVKLTVHNKKDMNIDKLQQQLSAIIHKHQTNKS